MMKIFVLCAVFSGFLSTKCHSQVFEDMLFSAFCDQLGKTNDDWMLKKDMKGIILAEDISGYYYVWFTNESGATDSASVKKYGPQKCIDILRAPDLPIFPLKDTINIIDDTRFFRYGLAHIFRQHYYRIGDSSEAIPNGRRSVMHLKNIYLRNNKLTIMATYSDEKESYPVAIFFIEAHVRKVEFWYK